VRIYKVFPGKDCNPHCEDSIKSAIAAVETWLTDGEIGTVITIVIIEMDKTKFDLLPEYQGP